MYSHPLLIITNIFDVKGETMKKKSKTILNIALMATTVAIFTAVTIVAMGPMATQIDQFVFPEKVITHQDPNAIGDEVKTPQEIAEQIQAEGTVLLKNDGTLPLAESDLTNVNVFGWSSTQWIGGGSGSGRVVSGQNDLNVKVGLLDALNAAGYNTNTELTDFYKSYCSERPMLKSGTLNSYDYQFHRLIEPKMSDYSNKILKDAEDFSDTALVVLGRMSGESSDAPKVQYKGNKSSSTPDDRDRTYLEISTEEEDLLNYVAENYGNVIVLVNSTNTMELSFLNTIRGINAALLVGATGTTAASVIPDILNGKINPSGKLADTYAYDLSTNASYQNAGMDGIGTYTNGKGYYPADGTTNGNVGNNSQKYDGVSYLDYCEDIYVGYRFYETADSAGYFDDVTNEYGSGYDGVVQYPFGYGLSYTDFSWQLKSKTSLTSDNAEDTFTVTVEVTNTGSQAGKDVVELYYQPPYTTNGIEKADTNLLAFEKTPELQPGEKCEVSLSFSLEEMDSYDCYDKNNDGHKGYELEKGVYNLQLKSDAHNLKDMKNNVIPLSVKDDLHYDTDSNTGKQVSNKFTGTDAIDGIALDGSDSNADIRYMTRSDFEETFPKKKEANRAMSDELKATNLYTAEMANKEINDADEAITTGKDSGLKIYENNDINDLGKKLGASYDDPEWDALLDQMTIDEMKNLTLHGYVGTRAVKSIGKPALKDCDGPNQSGSFNTANPGMGYPNSTTLAQTYNRKLARMFGKSLGQESRARGYTGWYGPGLNIHRSAFGGRNYEYYSEDPQLSGLMATSAIKGSNSTGVYCYLKHIALYEQESMRDGIYTFCTEQAFREIYLKPFRLAVELGNATGIMTSYNRIGAIWAGGSKALITGVIRDEWNFNGAVLTDYADHHAFMNLDHALRAGGDLFMDGWASNGKFFFETESNTFKKKLREASKHIIYSWLAVNVEREDNTTYETVKQPWRQVLIAIDCTAAIGVLVWAFFIFAYPAIKTKKEEKTQN